MLNREFISEIKTSLKADNIDQRISGRFILSKAEGLAEKFVEQMRITKLMRQFDILSTIKCFDMERLNSYDCPIYELRACEKLMVSKEEIPDYFVTMSGYGFSMVSNIDGSTIYEPIRNLARFKEQMKREFGKQFKYYYVANNKLYLANSTSKAVTITGLFKDQQEVDELNGDADECKSKLDQTFVCPKGKIADIKAYIIQEILMSRMQIRRDENPDLDENQISKAEA